MYVCTHVCMYVCMMYVCMYVSQQRGEIHDSTFLFFFSVCEALKSGPLNTLRYHATDFLWWCLFPVWSYAEFWSLVCLLFYLAGCLVWVVNGLNMYSFFTFPPLVTMYCFAFLGVWTPKVDRATRPVLGFSDMRHEVFLNLTGRLEI